MRRMHTISFSSRGLKTSWPRYTTLNFCPISDSQGQIKTTTSSRFFFYFIRQHTKVTACDNMRLSFDLINLRHYKCTKVHRANQKKREKQHKLHNYTNQNAGMEPCSLITDSLCLHKMAMKTYWQPMNSWLKECYCALMCYGQVNCFITE